MSGKKVAYILPNQPSPRRIVFDPNVCDGCIRRHEPLCVKACRMDMLVPNPENGKPPLVLYPEECCECGCCVHACPKALQGSIRMVWPLMEKMRWKRKETGEHLRFDMPNPPPPNPKPPVSGWYPE